MAHSENAQDVQIKVIMTKAVRIIYVFCFIFEQLEPTSIHNLRAYYCIHS